jgi:hypothetical protein
MKKTVYSYCWKCEKEIFTNKECNYFKSRDGNYSFCDECYKQFLNNNKEFIRPERSKREELKRSLYEALSNFHDYMIKERDGGPIHRSYETSAPTFLIHKNKFWRECDACIEILSIRCSEHCGNTVREVQ